jgi:hypothetical protein
MFSGTVAVIAAIEAARGLAGLHISVAVLASEVIGQGHNVGQRHVDIAAGNCFCRIIVGQSASTPVSESGASRLFDGLILLNAPPRASGSFGVVADCGH